MSLTHRHRVTGSRNNRDERDTAPRWSVEVRNHATGEVLHVQRLLPKKDAHEVIRNALAGDVVPLHLPRQLEIRIWWER